MSLEILRLLSLPGRSRTDAQLLAMLYWKSGSTRKADVREDGGLGCGWGELTYSLEELNREPKGRHCEV